MLQDSRLNIFLEVARKLSFTGASYSLGISQPAVSQNIAELEKELGVRLFERRAGDISLTPEGRIFLSYAESITQLYEDASILLVGGEGLRPIRIAATEFVSETLLGRVMGPLRRLSAMDISVTVLPSESMKGEAFPEDTDLCVYTEPSASPEVPGCYCIGHIPAPAACAMVLRPSSSLASSSLWPVLRRRFEDGLGAF